MVERCDLPEARVPSKVLRCGAVRQPDPEVVYETMHEAQRALLLPLSRELRSVLWRAVLSP